jgi:tripeptide aminopeptidase
MDRMEVQAEARAHNPRLRARIVTAYLRAFERAARSVRSSAGKCGQVDFRAIPKYEAFKLAAKEPCVIEAERAIRAAGLEPQREIATGGLDANWLAARGFPTVTLGAGMRDVHKAGESLVVREYLDACGIALRLATGNDHAQQSAGCRPR